MEKINSSKASKRKLMSLSGGCLLDPHVECGFKSKYFPIDSVLRFILVEDLILWRRGYTSHLEENLTKILQPEDMIHIDTMITSILLCLFSKSFVILEHFGNFEETFEKSAIISTILRTVARKHGPYLDVISCTSIMKNWFYPNKS
ncbi:uncharacterized protein LOC124204483 [Daphnia pulex]|uniref:uncharacterized protein LOC124204483 n=1 Tax=Daphnia pulex TaxID=6669 RepID=UPI001EDCC00F|nr:uncharacterized protein LOC124204483 [Daphnia pulex]